MIVSEQWLRDWVSTDLSAQQIADRLTLAGLEVDGIQSLPGTVEHVVVGQVQSVTKHPDADRLNLTTVNIGSEELAIVCGASNVREGLLVPVALVGASLPNGLTIKKAKVRGVESNGMLCSAAELGLEAESDGLLELDEDAQIGQRVDEYLSLNDALIDIDLTPNRGDCLSIKGVARELRVLAGGSYHPLDVEPKTAELKEKVKVSVLEPERCPSYLARVIKNIDASASTPVWMQERLRRSGLRCKSPIVDITNYVMLELGQPMHAFDLNKVKDEIIVRTAKSGESIVLLDGSTAKLDEQTLVIADKTNPIAIAGVMGGSESAIDDATSDIILEAAHFTKSSAAGTARRYGLHTDSSHRYERGVDPLLPHEAMDRATELVLEICGGEAATVSACEEPTLLANRKQVAVRFERLEKLLGMSLERQEVADILGRVSEQVEAVKDGWLVTAPSYRFDIEYEADLIEEIARVKGYDNIPTTIPRIAPTSRVASEQSVAINRVRLSLVPRGYFQAITYSFVDPRDLSLFSVETPAKVSNPLAENLSVMRTTLLPGLVKTAQFNLNRQKERIRLFEVGATYHLSDSGFTEKQTLGGLVTGPLNPIQWGLDHTRKVDFYDLKADVEALLQLTGSSNSVTYKVLEHLALHPGQSAEIVSDNTGDTIGYIGRLHPQLQQKLDFPNPVYVFELTLKTAMAAQVPAFSGIYKFPESKRDLSVVVADDVVVADLLEVVRDAVGSQLVDVTLFDVYTGQGVESKKQSLSLKLSLRDPARTLTDEESEQAVKLALGALEQKFDAKLR